MVILKITALTRKLKQSYRHADPCRACLQRIIYTACNDSPVTLWPQGQCIPRTWHRLYLQWLWSR